VEAEAQAVETSSETVRPEARIFAFQRGDVLRIDQRMIDRGNGVLPDQFFGGHLGAEVAGARAHVAVGELEPGPGEGVGELVRVFQETPRDFS
jgi:hypothetical protein